MKKLIAILVFLGLTALLGWKLYEKVQSAQSKKGGASRRDKNVVVAVELTPVRTMTIRDTVLFTGSLLPKSYFVVAPKVSGRLEKLMVNIGDRVKCGQLVAVLDDAEYVQQVEQARAELDVAKAVADEVRAVLAIGEREYKRVQGLREKGVASTALFDRALARYKSQRAKVKVAEGRVKYREAVLKAVQVRLSYTRIHVSWPLGVNGENVGRERVIGERFIDEGAMMRANDSIVSVLDIDDLTAVIHVIERDYSKIQLGQEAQATTDAFPGKTFTGKVIRVAPLLREKARQARVEVEIPNKEHLLKPGMFVRLQIEFDRHENATVVPVSALSRRHKKRGVFLADLEKMKARFVPLELGIQSEGNVEVLSPPLSGMVVSIGQHLLGEDSTITVPNGVPAVEDAASKAPGPAGER